MSTSRLRVFLWLGLLASGVQSGIGQQNFGVVQGRIAEGSNEVPAIGSILPKRIGHSLALMVPVSVHGSKTTWWIVDTGAPVSIIDPSFLQNLGLQLTQQARADGQSFPRVTINDFQMGTFRGDGISCVVRSIGTLKNVVLGHYSGAFEKTGVVGVNLLSKYGATINCRTQQIFFSPGGNLGMSRKKYEEMGFTYVPMNVTPGKRLEVTGTLGGAVFDFFLDTGAFTMLDDSIRNQVKLPFWNTNTRISGPFHDFTKWARYSYGIATDFKLGNYDAKGARLGSTNLNLSETGSSHRLAGLIGMDFLLYRSAIIDIGGRALYLKPSSSPR